MNWIKFLNRSINCTEILGNNKCINKRSCNVFIPMNIYKSYYHSSKFIDRLSFYVFGNCQRSESDSETALSSHDAVPPLGALDELPHFIPTDTNELNVGVFFGIDFGKQNNVPKW